MRRYKNTVTGAVLDTPCVISGKNWTELGADAKASVKKPQSKQEADTEADDDSDLDVDAEQATQPKKGKK